MNWIEVLAIVVMAIVALILEFHYEK